jgi:hypothetical protein
VSGRFGPLWRRGEGATFRLWAPAAETVVPVGNLSSNVFVMESAEQRNWQDATEPMNLARGRCILVQ